jgi:hypothetical protein
MLPVIGSSGWVKSCNQEFGFEPSICMSGLDNLQPIRQQTRRELLLESHKHPALRLLRQIPSIGPIRAALLVALLQTPYRFGTKRQLWPYSGFAVKTHDSGEYRYVRGKVRRNRERITVCGLNDNNNRDRPCKFLAGSMNVNARSCG